MTILGQLIRRPDHDGRAISFQDLWGRGLDVDGDWGSNTSAGMAVTQESALRMAAVWACVRVYCDSIASLPIDTYRRDGDYRRPMGMPAWLERPNPATTRYEFWEQTVQSLLLAGNAYWAPVWQATDLVELWPLPASNVRPRSDSSGDVVYDVTGTDGVVTVTASGGAPQIIHLRAHTAAGSLVGMSPIEVARQAIGLGLVAEEFGATFFARGSSPSVALELPESMGNPTQAQVTAFKDAWEDHHAGRNKHHRPAVLPGGAKLAQLTIPPEHAQFIETRKFQLGEIARIFRVPPHMIGDLDRATFSNIEHQSIEFVVHSLRPWLVRIEQVLDRLLPGGRYARFNVDGLLRGDQKSRLEAYSMGRMWGIYSANDIRALEDLGPIDSGDTYLIPANMVDALHPIGGGTPPPPPPPA